MGSNNLAELVKYDSDYRIGENAYMGFCGAPCREYGRIDVGIGSDLAYMDSKLWTIEHLRNNTHPQQPAVQGRVEYLVKEGAYTQKLRSPANWNRPSQERGES